MILKHFSLRNHPLHVAQYLDSSLEQGGVAVHREQTLSHLCEKSYNISHALHIYLFAIAPFKLVITLRRLSRLYSNIISWPKGNFH
jgi:hypothetical protein